ncbi:P-loop NTPase fold protein [Flavobacterium sp. XS2P12]|uniref:P-loop NTPase fold protein n=1 Tax=Flavobacterium melibiosi TaxID=3398734 RepID=UPI003A8C0061
MSKIQPNFLDNLPIGDDLFEGKSQEKIGVVVADIIKNKNFQIIGIDGAWGTGKSNLVKIIDNKLPDFKFFIYDVWGHQEDDQRKAILVELTEFISDKGNNMVSNKSKWKEKLKRLLAKEKEVTTINRPYLSIGFILSLLSIIYVPTLNTFIKDIKDFHGITDTIIKILLILFPIFLIIIIYSSKVIFQLIWKGSRWQSFKIALQQTFQVYTNKQEEETKIETISENEPSVKDFRNWMKEIDADLGEKKLVLVFDNFDRLPKKQILSIWSSIHIFFAEEKYKNIKVIIPFDRLHIKNAFKELDANSGINDYANDYVNKTFDLVYRVSQPILSDWKVFFKDRWKEAFTIINEEEFLKIIQIYEVYRTSITPREIIACINEIVSIKLLDDTIPDRYIILFVLNKDTIIENPLKAITEADFLKGLSYLYKDDENFQKYITALAYQINSNDALEVAYRKQLKDSLVNNNAETFLEISKTGTFHKIIPSVLSEIENFDNPILVLDSLSDTSKISEIEKQSIWDDIYLRIKNMSHNSSEVKDSQRLLVKHIDIHKGKIWIRSILEQLRIRSNFDAVKFAEIIDDFDKFLDDNKIQIDIFVLLKSSKVTEVEAKIFIPFVSNKKVNYKKYCLTTQNDELNQYLIELDIDSLAQLNYVNHLKNDFKLNDFIEELSNKIQSNKSDKNKLAVLYRRLKDISEKPLKAKLSDPEIYTLITQITDSEDFYYDLVAMRMAKLNNFNSSYASAFSVILNSDNEDITNKIAQRIEFYISYNDFLIGAQYFKDSILYKSVARRIITDEVGSSKANLHELLENFEDICSNIEIDPDIFLLSLNSWEFDEIKSENVIAFPLFLFQLLKTNDSSLSKHILNLANEYFSSLDKEEWIAIFNNFDSSNFKLLKIIDFQGWNSFSSEGLKNALIQSILSRKFNKPEEWSYLFDSFNKSGFSLTNTLKDIRDKFYGDGTLINKALFMFLIDPFIESSVLNDKPGDAFRTFFKVEFLDDGGLVNLKMKHSDAIKGLLQKSPSADVSDFKQAIRDRNENSENIKLLATKLDIQISKK